MFRSNRIRVALGIIGVVIGLASVLAKHSSASLSKEESAQAKHWLVTTCSSQDSSTGRRRRWSAWSACRPI